MSPALMWDGSVLSADGAALACPLCGWVNLHLDMVWFAMPAEMYEPTVGVDIDAGAGAVVFPGGEAMCLHGAKNRGPMIAVGYWCEAGCRGRIELRQHKGNLFLSLVEEPGFDPEDMATSAPAGDGAGAAEQMESSAPF
jgi:hypothetical protein